MKCKILHETTGRLRVHLCCGRMTVSQADVLEYYLRAQDGVQAVKVYDRTQDAVVLYDAERGSVLRALAVFSFAKAEAMELVPEHTSRALNREFEDKLAVAIMRRCISKLFLPAPITTALALLRSVKYIREGLSALWHGKLSVAVLDATAVTVSMARGDFATAGSVMFMLHLGEILEEWTHKKSVADLASAMSLRVDSVWQQVNGTEVLTKITDVKPGDRIVIRTGGMIPLDGRVVEGEAMVNQSSLTGESMPVAKHPGSPVYAGTVAEEGECVISVEKSSGSGRYDRVVRMIEESEKLKSTAEDKASRMADRLVPYTLGGTALTYLLTRNVTKMLAVLMVDFSCALKLAIPIAVLSAMRESSGYHISVKGGRFLEAVAKADTIVFDKTGTLTYATPTVAAVVPFGGRDEAEMLRLAACLEEHYPHSMANAVVAEAKRHELTHEEYHSQVQYVVAHGISSMVEGKKVIIGSAHFVFEDEGCRIPEGEQAKFDALPAAYSHLYLCMDGGAGGGHLHPRSPAPGGTGGGKGAARERLYQCGDDDRRQPPHGGGCGRRGGRGRRVCRGAAGGQGRLYPAGKGKGTHRYHGGRRRQRFSRPLRSGRGHRHLHRCGHRPGDRRYHRCLGGSVCAGNTAQAQ